MRCDNEAGEHPLDSPQSSLRRITVTNRLRYEKLVPEVRMIGLWLASAGFTGGCRLAVAVSPGRLVITIAEPPAQLSEPPGRRRWR